MTAGCGPTSREQAVPTKKLKRRHDRCCNAHEDQGDNALSGDAPTYTGWSEGGCAGRGCRMRLRCCHPRPERAVREAIWTLSLTGRDGQDACMSTPTAAAARQKKTPKPPGKPRRRSGSGNGQPSVGPRSGRRLWPLVIALVVFLMAYIMDTSAVGRLVWACLAGQFGPRVRLAASGVLVLIGGMLALALWSRQLPAAPARKPRPKRPRNTTKPASPGPEDAATPDQGGATARGSLPRASRPRTASGRSS
jgi:hypothetical protein